MPLVYTSYPHFDEKYHHLALTEHVDCIFLGSSLVWSGIDISAFESAYWEQGGEQIQCYNLGLILLTTTSAVKLAEIIIQDFQPKLLIYGFNIRDVAHVEGREYEAQSTVVEHPWVRWRLGDRNLEGYLFEYSYLYRYGHQWNRNVFINPPHLRADDGYSPFIRYGELAPRYGNKIFGTLNQPSPEHIQSLSQFNALKTQLLVLEMPLPPETQYANYENAYDNQMQILLDQFSPEIPIWRTNHFSFDTNDWGDSLHLNIFGAKKFSTWLGQALAIQNDFKISVAPPPEFFFMTEFPPSLAQLPADLRKQYNTIIPAVNGQIFLPSDAPIPLWSQKQTLLYAFQANFIPPHDIPLQLQGLKILDQTLLEAYTTRTPQQQEALTRWRNSKAAQDFHESGFDYLLVHDLWLRQLTPSELETIQNDYELVLSWDHPIEYFSYYVYR